ncbi:MAG: hypothetical protein L6R37_007781 [Teloschistes peruensis]|nr:MAG: hypothetical protein L6R37_007781 [Teloschistes peruensis]
MDRSSENPSSHIVTTNSYEHLPYRPRTSLPLGVGQVVNLLESINPGKGPLVHGMIGLGTSHWVSLQDCEDAHWILQVTSRDDKGYDARDQAALQEYLVLSTFLPVPRILAYDSTERNLLHRQYVIQTGIWGLPLADHIRWSSKMDRMYFIPTLANVMHQMENMVFQSSGRLVAASCIAVKKGLEDERTDTLRMPGTILQHEAESLCLIKPQPFLFRSGAFNRETASYATLKDLMYTQFQAWYTSESSLEPQILYGIAKQMSAIGLFARQEPNVLWHREFGPNNIFVDRTTGEWVVTGIVGWHDVLSVPRVLTRQPPEWLWTDGSRANSNSSAQHLDASAQEIKDAFDRYMERISPGWREDAYGTGYWIRRLARFAIDRFQFRGDHKTTGSYVRIGLMRHHGCLRSC